MNKNNLIIGRALFLLSLIIVFGIIIMNEKGGEIFSPKIKTKLTNYLEQKYPKQINKVVPKEIIYNNKTFKMKIQLKENKHHYFYITYSKGKIKDTYKKDYVEGKNILNYRNKTQEKLIMKITNEKVKIKNISTLNKYTEDVQEQIINNSNLLNLKYYYIEKNMKYEKKETIENDIISFINEMNNKNINPKYYKITITDIHDITKSIEISGIDNNFSKNIYANQIINDILNNNDSPLLSEYKIKYKKLNEEE